MKIFLPLAVVVFALSTELAKADSQTERIRKAAKEKSAALAAGNYGRVVDSTYPKLVEMIGGRDKMIETLRHGAEEMKAHGSAIIDTDIREPEKVVTAGDKQFAIVPTRVTVKQPLADPHGGLPPFQPIGHAKGFLIAISADSGNTWTFIDFTLRSFSDHQLMVGPSGQGYLGCKHDLGNGREVDDITKKKLSQVLPDFPPKLLPRSPSLDELVVYEGFEIAP
jgi:hypothetical protein